MHIAAGSHEVPTTLPLIAAVLSIGVKEWMYWYTRNAGKKIDSPALIADAWHHRSDALSSIGSFIGILGAKLGLPWADSAASILICLLLTKVAYDVFMDCVNQVTDHVGSSELVTQIQEISLEHDEVMQIDDLRVRRHVNRVYVDLELALRKDLTFERAHKVAEDVHDTLERRIPKIVHCTVHVNPVEVSAASLENHRAT